MDYERLEKKIDENYDKIIKNMNRLHSHEEMICNNAEKIERNSYALEFVRDYKKESRRFFISTIIFGVCCILMLIIMLLK